MELSKFMGSWYVLAGRFTILEKEVHNGLEKYTYIDKENYIDIDFTYNQGSFSGEKKAYPQKGYVVDPSSNTHWKISPLWPFKFDYLVLALADDYSWTAIGVPDQKYLWIMARDWKNPQPTIDAALKKLRAIGYDVENLKTVPHQW